MSGHVLGRPTFRPQNCPFLCGDLEPPYNTWFPGPLQLASKSQTASRSAQPTLHSSRQSDPYTLQRAVNFALKIALSRGGSPSNTWYLGFTRVNIPNGIMYSKSSTRVGYKAFRCHAWAFCLWPPCVADADIIFLPCGFFPSSIFFFYSSPNLSSRRLDVYNTSTHGVALVQI